MSAARRARRRRQREKRAQRLERRGGGSAALRAFTSSALALQGLAERAAAASPPVDYQADYRYARYSEDALSRSDVAPGGETDRYEIDIHQFRFLAPVGKSFDVGLELAHETMSGATPWYVTPDPGGGDDPVVVMTEATIDEARTDALLSGTWYRDTHALNGGVGFSIENDYLSFNGGLGGERTFNEKNTTLSGGVGFSYDLIEPEDTDLFPERPENEDKQSYTVFAGLSQVLGRNTHVQTSLSYQHSRGFLSDPYKLAFVAGSPIPDKRPDDRNQFAWLSQLRHHFPRLDASLHLDYQFGFDDWEMRTHAIELAWYQTFFDRFRVVPSFRYYSQSQADFYAPFYVTARGDGLASSDYRLSPFGAISGGIRVETRFQIWSLLWEVNVSYERYVSDAGYALESVDVENPGLVDYDLIGAGLTLHF